jgi:hypothetical protein
MTSKPYRVSYCDYATGKEVAADGPLAMSKSQVLELLAEVLREPGSFVSVTDAGGRMLQFVLDDDGSVMLDVPYPEKRGSYAKRSTLAACLQLVRDLGGRVEITAIDGLEFERW